MIAAPIVYGVEDQALVSAFENLAPDLQLGVYWSAPELQDFRSRVKTFYIEAQSTRCCYCNRHLGTINHRSWDVEHVASRNKYARFMFTPTNLAASCPDCNLMKADKEALTNPKRKTYPKNSAGFRIIHPHFDTFEEHIHTIGMVYVPKSEKGKNTIYTCDLMRFAVEFINWENSAADSSFEEEVEVVFDEKPIVSEAAIDAIITKLQIK